MGTGSDHQAGWSYAPKGQTPIRPRAGNRFGENVLSAITNRGDLAFVDIGPIGKAPFYYFIPGHFRLCLTCASCNLRCKYCQNSHLSQKSLEELNHSLYSPEEIIQEAKRQKLNSISFTYTEPTVY
jgi:pyruvate formate lyase activating enzyme